MRSLLFVLIVFFSTLGFAQQGGGGTPLGVQYFSKAGKEVATLFYPQPDLEKLRKEDRVNDSLKTGPWRFGYNYDVHLNFFEQGSWLTRANGDQVLLLKVWADGAKTINFTFSNTTIPEGNELYIYNADRSFVLGKFTSKHLYKGELGSELIPGEVAYVEYVVPKANANNKGHVEIARITYGYRTAAEYQAKVFGSAGNCNMNVNCPDGAPFKEQRNSAVMLVSGSSGFCSGALINNTSFDGKPYVLTANHCYNANVASWVFRFNWQSEDCNNPSDPPAYQSLSGATLRARRQASDFLLVEITGGLSNGIVPETHRPFYAGWDNSATIPSNTYSIHHPSGDIKKISFDDEAPSVTQATISGVTSDVDGVFKVTWDRNTVTEGGSSGSPLYNHKGQIIGQLWGGNSGCFNAGTSGAYDFYGRVHTSWNPAGSSQGDQLKYWLDPNNQGESSLPGYDPYQELHENDVVLLAVSNYEQANCTQAFYPEIEIMNKGTENLTSLIVQYEYGNGVSNSFTWNGNLASYEVATVDLPLHENLIGDNSITVTLTQPNEANDGNEEDNSLTVHFSANPMGAALEFEFFMSCWPEENAWELRNENNEILYSGGNYPTGSNSNFGIVEEFCLNNGCYQLILKDSYGDGVSGGTYNNCDFFGSMTLTQLADGTVLAHLPEEEGNFGSEITFDFCIDNASIAEENISQLTSVYPNPTQGFIFVEMDFVGEKTVELTDISGQIIQTEKTNKQLLKLQGLTVAKGIYFVNIYSKNEVSTHKLIVQ